MAKTYFKADVKVGFTCISFLGVRELYGWKVFLSVKAVHYINNIGASETDPED
jgi:hypothetical protein